MYRENFEEFKEVIDPLIDSTTCKNRQRIDILPRKSIAFQNEQNF